MNRRNLVFRGLLAALALMLPIAPAPAQQLDMSRKAVVDDPVARRSVGVRVTTTRSSSSSTITAPIAGAWNRC